MKCVFLRITLTQLEYNTSNFLNGQALLGAELRAKEFLL